MQGRVDWREFLKFYGDTTPEQRAKCLTCDKCGVVEPDPYLEHSLLFYEITGAL